MHAYLQCLYLFKDTVEPYTKQDQGGCATAKKYILEWDLWVNFDKIIECQWIPYIFFLDLNFLFMQWCNNAYLTVLSRQITANLLI